MIGCRKTEMIGGKWWFEVDPMAGTEQERWSTIPRFWESWTELNWIDLNGEEPLWQLVTRRVVLQLFVLWRENSHQVMVLCATLCSAWWIDDNLEMRMIKSMNEWLRLEDWVVVHCSLLVALHHMLWWYIRLNCSCLEIVPPEADCAAISWLNTWFVSHLNSKHWTSNRVRTWSPIACCHITLLASW